jgi:hypothetical protein
VTPGGRATGRVCGLRLFVDEGYSMGQDVGMEEARTRCGERSAPALLQTWSSGGSGRQPMREENHAGAFRPCYNATGWE